MLTSQVSFGRSAPFFSVITPVRNERKHIETSLQSLKRQSFGNIEHIIVDGSSTDGTLQLLEDYAREAPYPVRILRDVNGGVYAALNRGVGEASGDYIVTLHGSDRFSADDVLQRAAGKLEESDADLLYGDLHYVNGAGKIVRHYSGRRFRAELLLDGFMPPHPTVIARRSLFDSVGDYSLRFAIAGDYDWLCRAILIHKAQIVYLPYDMVEMSDDGISSRWSSRLWGNNRDKYLSLKANGFKVCPLRLLKRYLYL